MGQGGNDPQQLFSTFNLEIMIQWEMLSQTFRLRGKCVLNTSTPATIFYVLIDFLLSALTLGFFLILYA